VGPARWSPARVGLAAAAVALAAAGCTGDSSIVSPKGSAARSVTDLWWPMLAVATAVFVFVTGMLLLAAARGRRKTEEQAQATPRWGEPFIVVAGVVVSGAILVGFFLFSLAKVQALEDAGRRSKLTVSVVGHDWWWEVRYPNGAVSANEIHIPTGERVRLALDTDDVIHSFWVPRLGPKIDMVPGLHNHLWLQAAEPGVYRGQCAEFCGLQHANMIIRVVADTPADFDRPARRTPPGGPSSRPRPVPVATPSGARRRWGRRAPTSPTSAGARPSAPGCGPGPKRTSPAGSPIPSRSSPACRCRRRRCPPTS
jgi:cytochrome c oxidase subunit 2